jgi:hypothetical protein
MAPVPRGPAVAQRAATGPAAAGPDHRQPSRRRTGRVLAAVVVVAALAAGAVMLMSHRSVHRGRTPAPGPTASNGKGSAGSSPASTTVTVKDPGTGGATTVPLPAKVTAAGPVTASIEVGSDAFVLAGDRVWRVPLPGSPVRPVLNTTALTGPAGPLRLSVSGQLTLSGSNGRVTYVIDPGSLTVCAASSATAASVCGSTVSQQNRGS